MSQQDPASALNGIQSGPWCDSCNRRLAQGEEAGMYATWYEQRGWTPRRTWCVECCPESIDPGTENADEVIVEAVFWGHRLVGVRVKDRNPPLDEAL